MREIRWFSKQDTRLIAFRVPPIIISQAYLRSYLRIILLTLTGHDSRLTTGREKLRNFRGKVTNYFSGKKQ